MAAFGHFWVNLGYVLYIYIYIIIDYIYIILSIIYYIIDIYMVYLHPLMRAMLSK